MNTQENDRLISSIFGELEPVEKMIEIDGKIYNLQGRETPRLKEPALCTLRIVDSEVTH